tara:strand:- start:333 stop:533 length:201 start_codon:yes stop_codon:yes gene_type:complete
MDNATNIHVFYTDRANGWCFTLLDEEEFQVGEAEYSYRKVDAVEMAKRYGLPVKVFGRNGLFQKTA